MQARARKRHNEWAANAAMANLEMLTADLKEDAQRDLRDVGAYASPNKGLEALALHPRLALRGRDHGPEAAAKVAAVQRLAAGSHASASSPCDGCPTVDRRASDRRSARPTPPDACGRRPDAR